MQGCSNTRNAKVLWNARQTARRKTEGSLWKNLLTKAQPATQSPGNAREVQKTLFEKEECAIRDSKEISDSTMHRQKISVRMRSERGQGSDRQMTTANMHKASSRIPLKERQRHVAVQGSELPCLWKIPIACRNERVQSDGLWQFSSQRDVVREVTCKRL